MKTVFKKIEEVSNLISEVHIVIGHDIPATDICRIEVVGEFFSESFILE